MAAKTEPRRLNLTKASIESIRVPKADRCYWYDAKQPGLAICITATGQRTFYVYRKINGRPVRLKLGRYPDLSLEQARKSAATALGDIAKGKDPQAEKRLHRGELTFGELFDYFLEHHAKPHKKTWREDEKMFKRYLSSWRTRKISTIKKSDVSSKHAKLGTDSGLYAANRTLGLIITLFNQAADMGFEKTNPARGVKKFKERSRERFIHADELPRFFKALDDEPSVTCRDFFKMALLTGARRSNVLAMRWDEIQMDRATWTIPDTKTGDSLTVTLSPDAVAILLARQEATDGSPWVFPGNHKGKHLKDPTKPWKAVLSRAGLTDLRIHDLRRTLGSWQAATGSSLHVVGKSLGHKQPSTTAIYARLDLDPVRESVNRATAAMFATVEAAKPKKKARKGARNGKA